MAASLKNSNFFQLLRHDLPGKDADFRRKLDKIRVLAQESNNYRHKSAVLSGFFNKSRYFSNIWKKMQEKRDKNASKITKCCRKSAIRRKIQLSVHTILKLAFCEDPFKKANPPCAMASRKKDRARNLFFAFSHLFITELRYDTANY